MIYPYNGSRIAFAGIATPPPPPFIAAQLGERERSHIQRQQKSVVCLTYCCSVVLTDEHGLLLVGELILEYEQLHQLGRGGGVEPFPTATKKHGMLYLL